MKIKEIVGLLGRIGTDRVTGMTGAITQVSFELGGDIRVCLVPHHNVARSMVPSPVVKPDEYLWVSVRQLKTTEHRVLDAPEFIAKLPSPV